MLSIIHQTSFLPDRITIPIIGQTKIAVKGLV